MRRRGFLAIAAGGLLAGCKPAWRSEEEEFAYLRELANPTPEQWKRRNALTVKFASEVEAREREADARREAERITIDMDLESPAETRERLKAEEAARKQAEIEWRREAMEAEAAAEAKALIVRARREEAESPGIAARYYGQAAKLLPGGSEKARYEEVSRKLWTKAYGNLPYEAPE